MLNLLTGVPTAGIVAELDKKQGKSGSGWPGTTDGQGRIAALYPADQQVQTGIYRVVFRTGDYDKKHDQPTFFPKIPEMFSLARADQHDHIPLLLSQYGYSTYRGN